MPIKVLDLGDLQVTSRNTKRSLLLASSITLDIPASIDEQIALPGWTGMTGTGMTENGQLWISKASTCCLKVVASVQGVESQETPSTLPHYIADAIGDCTVSLVPSSTSACIRLTAPDLGGPKPETPQRTL